MLVTRVLGNCPECGGERKFGNVSIRRDSILRGCKSCTYSCTVPLPEIRKRILYLDQFFFSSAFRERDTRFVNAADRIRQLSAMQLIVAPFSSVHEDETHQWRGYNGKNKDDLMDFIKAVSRGHEFEPAYDVERTQIVRTFQDYLGGKPDKLEVEERDALEGEIHGWDDYFRIDVGHYLGDIELKRTLKQKSVETLVDIFPQWRQSTNTFEQDVLIEMEDGAKGYIQSYAQYVARVGTGDFEALIDSPIMSTVVETLTCCFPRSTGMEDKLKKIGEFFRSSHFMKTPHQWISARIYAALKDMVKRGAYPDRESALRRLSGFFQDVQHVSTYAPYCDAFIMDQAMASLVSDPRIGLETRYGVKVFSLNNWDRFLTWLDDVEAGMTKEHRAGLAAAYQTAVG